MNKLLFSLILTISIILSFTAQSNANRSPHLETTELHENSLQKTGYVFLETPEKDSEPEISPKTIKEALKLIKSFIRQAKQSSSWQDLEEKLALFSKKMDKLFENISSEQQDKYISEEQLFNESFSKVLYSMSQKYKDEILKEKGLFAQYPRRTYYRVFFETEKKHFSFSKLKWMRTLRYKIGERPDSHMLSDTIKNAFLVLLNKEKFEITRIPVGTVTHSRNNIGKLEVSEAEYKQLDTVEFHQNHSE